MLRNVGVRFGESLPKIRQSKMSDPWSPRKKFAHHIITNVFHCLSYVNVKISLNSLEFAVLIVVATIDAVVL